MSSRSFVSSTGCQCVYVFCTGRRCWMLMRKAHTTYVKERLTLSSKHSYSYSSNTIYCATTTVLPDPRLTTEFARCSFLCYSFIWDSLPAEFYCAAVNLVNYVPEEFPFLLVRLKGVATAACPTCGHLCRNWRWLRSRSRYFISN